MLRGPQTPGELKQRTERLHAFAGLDGLEESLRGLIDRELVARLPRRPGQREERYRHLLGGAAADEEPAAAPEPSAAEAGPEAPAPVPSSDGLEGRVARLEDELAAVRADLRALRDELGAAE
jgi:uncharacterized protein